MPTVELVYDADCPNVADARRQLLRAFAEVRIEARWSEWHTGDPDAPAHVRGYGSPTILVDGRDVNGAEPSNGAACCRLYEDGGGGLRGVPPLGDIVEALTGKATLKTARSGRGWRTSAAILPGIGVSLLPKVACPACWPAYAAALSSIGLGLLLDSRYLFAFTSVFLAAAVGALAFDSRGRWRFGPLLLGLLACVVILAGKFVLENNLAMYGGLTLLLAASAWKSRRRRTRPLTSLSCAPAGSAPRSA